MYLTALSLYDILLSFPQEVQYIWHRKCGIGSFLYITIRYGTMIHILAGTLRFSPSLASVIVSYDGIINTYTDLPCRGVFNQI